jgi:hypothetical protein
MAFRIETRSRKIMSKRPGGLTALAVLNFVFAGLGILAYLALLAAAKLVDTAASKVGDAVGEKAPGVPTSVYVVLLIGFVTVAIMLTAGVGYIQQKKFLGRTLGNVYAVMSLGNTALSLAIIKGASFGFGTIIGLVYPVLTLILLNTVFKDDFVR